MSIQGLRLFIAVSMLVFSMVMFADENYFSTLLGLASSVIFIGLYISCNINGESEDS